VSARSVGIREPALLLLLHRDDHCSLLLPVKSRLERRGEVHWHS